MYPRVFDSTEDLKEAIFPENFYGTQLQRQIFPEDVGNRAYVEYDTLPPYEGDVTHRAEDAEELLNSGRVEDKEVEFWFRNADMPDSGFPLKIECDKLQDYVPEEYDMQASFNDVFTPFCPTVKDAPPAKEGLGIEQEIRGKVIGAHIQHGVLVDLGFNIAGLIPMYHQQDEKGLSSKCFETLGIQKFEEFFGPDKEVLVKVHALRFQQYASEDTYVYRFPIELELLEPGLDPETLAKPLDRLDGDSEAPIVLRDPRRRDLWEEMVQVTGRTLDDEFLDQLDSIASEFEMARKEQYDSINDMEIFDPNNDDFNKKRGSADPLWGIRNLAPKN